VVICLERGADLHMVQQIPLPLTVSCFSKIQIGFTFLVPAHLGSPGERAVKWGGVCVQVLAYARVQTSARNQRWSTSSCNMGLRYNFTHTAKTYNMITTTYLRYLYYSY